MRIKVSVSTDSIPNYGFWYVIDNNTTTILDLQRNLNDILHLSKSAKRLELSLDNFCLLPNSPIPDLIRDGDLIKVQHKGKTTPSIDPPAKTKQQQSSLTKKRKHDTTLKKRKQRHEEKEQPKPKRQKKTEKEQKRQKMTAKEQQPEQKHQKNTAKEQKREKETAPKDDTVSKSKKRNMRRTLARITKRERSEHKDTTSPTPVAEAIMPVSTPVTSSNNDKPVEPRHLLKKNKNKSKDFMKQMDKSTRSHVVFEEEAPEPDQAGYDDSVPTNDPINILGGAFITDSESQQKGKKTKGKQQNYLNRQYPVDETDAVFYAIDEVEEDSSSDDDSSDDDSSDDDSSDDDSSDDDSSDDDSSDDDNTNDASKDSLVDETPVVAKIDYDACPPISFQGPQTPKIGDHLAIKTLHLSETYTPEISDWKQVKVIELTGQEMVVELVGNRATHKTLRKFDLPPEHELGQQADDSTETHNYNDIFDMRKILA